MYVPSIASLSSRTDSLVVQNELKRANNRLDECNKKLQKVLTELAIAK